MIDRGGASRPLVELTRTRLLEFLREPEAVFWVFVFPLLLALALGIAFRGGRQQVLRIGVVEAEGAEEMSGRLEASPRLSVQLLGPGTAGAALRDGDVQLLVWPTDPPRYRFDPDSSEGLLARAEVDALLQHAAGRTDAFTPVDEQAETRGSRYIDWLVPGLVGMNIMGTSMWAIGFAIVQARTKKLLKRLLATPITRYDYLLAQILARLVFLGLEVSLLVGFAWLVFGVPTGDSMASLGAVTLAGALTFGALGLLLAARTRTVEAVSGWMNFVMMPMYILSGTFFSYANFPEAAQPFIRLLPLTALNDALRHVMLDNESIFSLGFETGVLALWGVTSFVLAVKIFRWR